MVKKIRPTSSEVQDFQRIFSMNFSKYWDQLTGFDICLFDEDLGTPDSTSTRDFIIEKYGDAARLLVESFLAYCPIAILYENPESA